MSAVVVAWITSEGSNWRAFGEVACLVPVLARLLHHVVELVQLGSDSVDLLLSGARLHPDGDLGAALEGPGGVGRPLPQQERRADKRERHGDGQDGRHRHEPVPPQVGRPSSRTT